MRELTSHTFYCDAITDSRIIDALWKVKRHYFVPKTYASEAYYNGPLPIGFEQTISQPFIIAYMIGMLELKSADSVLEIGTGSGYQTALLCELVDFVFSVERISQLSQNAEKVLKLLNYENFALSVHDGSIGWQEKGPFDAIVVSAEMPAFPQSLFNQLKEDGKLVVPVQRGDSTYLLKVQKINGNPRKTWDIAVRFVPIIGAEGF
ncbi:MAG: protein-L-isoaspartate(D-aspartate) O-methyltransferase [Candidatus Heimdallarchaeota archaeon]|nr:protein-L-isoaspartate(D-aspartate) O-methyltransferase [Candidatus Heimdallarchaeota archaeon]